MTEIVLAPLALLGIYWVYLGTFLNHNYSVSTFLDNTYLFHPIFSFISKSFSSGEFPYRMDSLMGGLSLYSTPQFSTVYPFYFFGANLYRTPTDALVHLHYVTLLHIGILYLNSYIMMRIFHLPVVSAIVGATFLAFSRNMNWYIMWVNITASYAWLPLAVGSIYLIVENKHPRSGLVLGAISFALLTTASPSQALIHLIYCTAFLLASYWIIHWKQRWTLAVVRNLVMLACATLILVAPALIPAAVSMKSTIRWLGHSGSVVGHERLPFKAFLDGESPPRELSNVLFPLRKVSTAVGNSYLGIIPFFLAVFALFKRRSDWIVVPLFLLGMYALLSSTGQHLGLVHINFWLPLWNKIREPERHLILFILTFATLSAFGFQFLWEWTQKFQNISMARLGVALLAFLIVLSGACLVAQQFETLIPVPYLMGCWLVLVLGLAALRFFPGTSGAPTKGLLAWVAISPTIALGFNVSRIDQGDYFAENNLRSHRVLQEIARMGDIRNYRLWMDDEEINSQRWAMNASYYGLRTFRCYMNPLPYAQWREIYFARRSEHYLKLLGAKYYLCRSCKDVPTDYKLEREIEGFKLFSTQRAMPRIFWTNKVDGFDGSFDNFLAKVDRSDKYLQEVFVEPQNLKRTSSWLAPAEGPARASILGERITANSVELSLKADAPGVLVLNEYFDKDWKVKVDGQPTDSLRVNRNQIGVLVRDGLHQIHYQFHPSLFVNLLLLQRVGFLVGLLVLGIILYRQREVAKSWFWETTSF